MHGYVYGYVYDYVDVYGYPSDLVRTGLAAKKLVFCSFVFLRPNVAFSRNQEEKPPTSNKETRILTTVCMDGGVSNIILTAGFIDGALP